MAAAAWGFMRWSKSGAISPMNTQYLHRAVQSVFQCAVQCRQCTVRCNQYTMWCGSGSVLCGAVSILCGAVSTQQGQPVRVNNDRNYKSIHGQYIVHIPELCRLTHSFVIRHAASGQQPLSSSLWASDTVRQWQQWQRDSETASEIVRQPARDSDGGTAVTKVW